MPPLLLPTSSRRTASSTSSTKSYCPPTSPRTTRLPSLRRVSSKSPSSDSRFPQRSWPAPGRGPRIAPSGDGPFTVFAPTNDAFDALGDTVTDLLKPENKDQLQSVLLYHVLGGEVSRYRPHGRTGGRDAAGRQGSRPPRPCASTTRTSSRRTSGKHERRDPQR